MFNIVAESLTELMREAQEKNLFEGFLVGRNNVDISLLQYVDDTIFFGKTSMANVKTIKVMLKRFELVSDLKINFDKSKFWAIGMSKQWKHNAASYLNYRLLSVPISYSGIPIGENPSCSET